MGHRVRRPEDDDRATRPSHPPLSYPRNRKRQLPLQEQLGESSQTRKGETSKLDERLTPKPSSSRVSSRWKLRVKSQRQTIESLHAGHRPLGSDAATFVSNKAVEQALKLLVGATVTTPVATTYGDVKIDIKDVGLQPSYGSTGVTLQLEISSSQRGVTIDVAADAGLAFRAVRTTTAADGHTLA